MINLMRRLSKFVSSLNDPENQEGQSGAIDDASVAGIFDLFKMHIATLLDRTIEDIIPMLELQVRRRSAYCRDIDLCCNRKNKEYGLTPRSRYH
jgi:hypothetical protein